MWAATQWPVSRKGNLAVDHVEQMPEESFSVMLLALRDKERIHRFVPMTVWERRFFRGSDSVAGG